MNTTSTEERAERFKNLPDNSLASELDRKSLPHILAAQERLENLSRQSQKTSAHELDVAVKRMKRLEI